MKINQHHSYQNEVSVSGLYVVTHHEMLNIFLLIKNTFGQL